jgi:SAM-dependent methyltransferase
MSLAYRISEYNRDRKWNTFLKEIVPTPEIRILDVGFSDEEHSRTDNYIEKHYPYQERLTALGVEVPVHFKARYPAVIAVHYSGGVFPFENQCFDVAWSNAVIEHVGDRQQQILFLKEIKRVAKRCFVTTPNKYFPIEVHTRTPLLHFLPKAVFDRYLIAVGQAWAAGDYMNLLSLNDIKTLLAEANITDYRVICNRLAGFTVDFVLLF